MSTQQPLQPADREPDSYEPPAVQAVCLTAGLVSTSPMVVSASQNPVPSAPRKL